VGKFIPASKAAGKNNCSQEGRNEVEASGKIAGYTLRK
jgi:hypothetical protein